LNGIILGMFFTECFGERIVFFFGFYNVSLFMSALGRQQHIECTLGAEQSGPYAAR